MNLPGSSIITAPVPAVNGASTHTEGRRHGHGAHALTAREVACIIRGRFR